MTNHLTPDWTALVRAQLRQLADGSPMAPAGVFAAAPADIRALYQDLETLEQVIAERDRVQQALTHEIHHRVKNNLQIVSSLLSMQANRSAVPAVRMALAQTRARMDALALIHRLFYESEDLVSQTTIDSARLLSELCGQLRQNQRGRDTIDFTWETSPFALRLDSAVPLALFAVEAITNAYNHGYPDHSPGQITLSSTATAAAMAQLVIADDGVGYADSDKVQECGTMGLALMSGFARQLGASFTSDTRRGTTVRLDYQITA